jgi:hypothetical protein
MEILHGFELLKDENIVELQTKAKLYRHVNTGAELLSLINDDENKVFGIAFRTPAGDSTGLPHIMEHSVLCGSRKYPVKEPFVEILKGSLQTFLNAMTYPDKTCYPVASQNVQDFYNLIDVYLDAVFYPNISPFIFQQEGWHYELEKQDGLLSYKGVVFNEMKGAYSSPDSLIAEYSQQSLFPDNSYGFDSGGDPEVIPSLRFEQFKEFHQRYYHPSNARIFFCGDDEPDERLRLVNEYLKDFERLDIDSTIKLQKHFDHPERIVHYYAAGEDEALRSKGMITVNWLLGETIDAQANMALHILSYILLGMPGSPLRKALIDSGLGEDIAGVGLENELKQMFFSVGLKGVNIEKADIVQKLILDTLTGLARDGIDPQTIEASINTIEFSLRENNTGSYPRGLALMFRSLTTWLYDGDPMALLGFESSLAEIRNRLNEDKTYFEDLIDRFFVKNLHRTTVILKPDSVFREKKEAVEKEKLAEAGNAMTDDQLQSVIDNTHELKKMQGTPDSPEALATIPVLKLADLDKKNKTIPLALFDQKGTRILYHDLPTNEIVYMDVGFDLHTLPQKYLSYVPLFGRALLQMGTEKEDFVKLSQRISRKTGGVHPTSFTSVIKNSNKTAAWLFLCGKVMQNQFGELLSIIEDVLLSSRLDNRERFRQMALEEKARYEQGLVPGGHQVVNTRLRAHFSEAGWFGEQMNGISYLFFLRRLAVDVDKNWPAVHAVLEEMLQILVNRESMIVNVTIDDHGWSHVEPRVRGFLEELPAAPLNTAEWSPKRFDDFEGMTIPAQVNYVGKGANLYELGYKFHGSANVISKYLRTTWLWERVRVQGGAYGAFCLFNSLSGVLTFLSYRDPNLVKTVGIFDKTTEFLRNIDLSREELTKGIIGATGDIDTYMLPDAKGYISLLQYLNGNNDEDRQRMRDEVLSTTVDDFRNFADVLEGVKESGLVKALGSKGAIEEAVRNHQLPLKIIEVM